MISNVRNVYSLLKQEILTNPVSWRLNSSLSKKVSVNEVDNSPPLEIKEDVLEEIQSPFNKSRLSLEDYNILHSRPPYRGAVPAKSDNLSLKYRREMFGTYGFESGVNPALCFHTKEEVKNIKEYERIAYDQTVRQMMEFALEQEKSKKMAILNREKHMDVQMSLQDEWKKKITAKMEEKLAEARDAQEKRDKLIKEIRKQLGYNIEPSDPRFVEVLEQKEAEAKKIKKQEKKKKREEYFLAKIAALEASAQVKPTSASDGDKLIEEEEKKSDV